MVQYVTGVNMEACFITEAQSGFSQAGSSGYSVGTLLLFLR